MAEGYARRSSTERDIQPVAIHSVNLQTRRAICLTRIATAIEVDCSFAVGESIVTPLVGEQWYVERFDSVWRLYGRIPFNDESLLIEPVEGQVLLGSTKGPLELNGTQINVNSDLVLGGTHYRSTSGELQRQVGDGSWVPVIPASGQLIIATDISDSSELGRTILRAASGAVVRTAIGAGTYTKPPAGIPQTDLDSEVRDALARANTALLVVDADDISDATSLGRTILRSTSAEQVRAALNMGTGTPTASTDIIDSTPVGRAVLTAASQAAARAAIGAATTSSDITDSTAVGRAVLTAASAAAARSAIGAGTGSYTKPGGGIPHTDIAVGMVTGSVNGTVTNMILWRGTLTQYNAITTKDPNTLYVTTGA